MQGQDFNISTLELRRLLFELKDIRPDIGVRLRLIGDMWQNNFFHVVKMTQEGAVFMDEHTNQLCSVKDLKSIVQFEIDKPFQEYQPHNHYSVDLLVVSARMKSA